MPRRSRISLICCATASFLASAPLDFWLSVLGHVGQRDDRFINFDRTSLFRIDLPADPGRCHVLAKHLPREAIVISAWRVAAISECLDENGYLALEDNNRVCLSFLDLFIAIYNSLWCSGYSRHMETDNSR